MANHMVELSEKENELGEVRACDCGGVQLSMGPMTLHFAAEEVDKLYELASAAKSLVDAKRERESTRQSGKVKRRPNKIKADGTFH